MTIPPHRPKSPPKRKIFGTNLGSPPAIARGVLPDKNKLGKEV